MFRTNKLTTKLLLIYVNMSVYWLLVLIPTKPAGKMHHNGKATGQETFREMFFNFE